MERINPTLHVENTTEGLLVTFEHAANERSSIRITTLIRLDGAAQGGRTVASLCTAALSDGAKLIDLLQKQYASAEPGQTAQPTP